MPTFNVNDTVQLDSPFLPDYDGALATVTERVTQRNYRLRFHDSALADGRYGNNVWSGGYLKAAPSEPKRGKPLPERWINVRVLGNAREACEYEGTTPEKVIEKALADIVARVDVARTAAAERTAREAAGEAAMQSRRVVMPSMSSPYTFTMNSDSGIVQRYQPAEQVWDNMGYTVDRPAPVIPAFRCSDESCCPPESPREEAYDF